jgi:colanic acid biosynthesis glycosyl transferase WcaI
MKILIYGLNYAPEMTGVGKYTAEMAVLLASRGHEVRVVCAPPYYPEWRVAANYVPWRYQRETRDGVTIWRAPLWVPSRPNGLKRMLHLASFAASSLPLLARQVLWRPDAAMLIEPTLMCAPATLAFARIARASAWLHIQDFEVDAAFDLGLLKSSRVARVARRIESALLRRFDTVSSITPQMGSRAVVKGVESSRIVCLPNWVDVATIFPLARASDYRLQLGIPLDQKVVLYSGNMGAKQGIETLAAAAASLVTRADVTFVFCGCGAVKESLIERCAGLTNCIFIPLQPVERLNELLNLADIHVLPQRGNAADLMMPSKLTGMFASGRAVVAMARHGTDLYDAVSPRGVVVPPDNVKALVAAITVLASDRERRAALGKAARNYAERALSPESTLSAFEERLEMLVRGAHGKRAQGETPYFDGPRSLTAPARQQRKPATTEEAAPD